MGMGALGGGAAAKAEKAAAARSDVSFVDHTWSLEKLEEF